MVSATLKNYRQSPRKVRLVTDLIVGKSLGRAQHALALLPKRATHMVGKILHTAIANAKQKGLTPEELVVKSARVDKGITLKRYQPRARGSSSPIHKHTSHITIVLVEKGSKQKKGSAKKA